MNQNSASTRKSKTILILSVITSLFMGVIGYELATRTQSKTQQEISSQKFTILSKEPHVSVHDRKQYAFINAQNQHLTNKVTALKEHALDLSRRLHTAQLAVFSAHKSHAQSMIQDLQVKLKDSEQSNNQLHTELAQLQQSFEDQDRQAMTMESTIDHLTEVIEIQRANKEKALEGMKASLETAASTEKNRLLEIIQDLEIHQTKLKTDLEVQTSEIARLEESLSQYKSYASENENALLFAVEQHEQKQKELLTQTETLASLLNLEEIAVQSLQSEIRAFEESEKNLTSAYEQQLKEHTLQLIQETLLQENYAHLLESGILQKQEELNLALANLAYAHAQLDNQKADIALLKEQRAERERELLQEKDVLLADLSQKQENLSLALSKFNSSEIALYDQNQEIEDLKERVAQNEIDLSQIRTMASDQMQQNNHLVVEMAQKQEELNIALSKFDRADLSLIEQQNALLHLRDQIAQGELERNEARAIATEQIHINQNLSATLTETQQQLSLQSKEMIEQQALLSAFKEQFAEREAELLQTHAILKAEIAQKEKILEDSEFFLSTQSQEISGLKNQIAQRELELVQLSDKLAEEAKANQQRIVDMALKHEEISTNVAYFAQEEVTALQAQMAQLEEELLQARTTLKAEIVQKEENLSLVLAKFDQSEASLSTQAKEIAALKEQITQRELELAQLNDKLSEEAKQHQQTLADMLLKQETLSSTVSQLAQEEIASIKEQMAQREEELLQMHADLKSDIAQKEENLSIALAKFDGSEVSLSIQAQEIAALKEQIALREQELVQMSDKLTVEALNYQQLIADMAAKHEEVSANAVYFAQEEISKLKMEMMQEKEELLQMNAALKADITEKEKSLSDALAEFAKSKAGLSSQAEEIVALKEQIALREQELVQMSDKSTVEALSYQQLIADMAAKHEEVSANAVYFAQEEISKLKMEMMQEKEELLQMNAALKADITEKEKSLSDALAEFAKSKAGLSSQAEQIVALKELISLREQELVQIGDKLAAEAVNHQQLITDMAAKHEEDSANVLHFAQEEVTSLKLQTAIREEELAQANAVLKADIAQKEEALSSALSKYNNQMEEISALKDQITQRELALVQMSDKTAEEIKAYQQQIADMSLKQEDMSNNVMHFAQEEIAALKEQMNLREQELLQANIALRAESDQKDQSLSLALSKFDSSEVVLSAQNHEIASLKEQISQREDDIKTHRQLIADMALKQEELADKIAQFHTVEAAIQAQYQDALTQKQEAAQREQDLMLINATLSAGLSEKEENLSLALSKFESSKMDLKEQDQILTNLKESFSNQTQELLQVKTIALEEAKAHQQLLVALAQNKEESEILLKNKINELETLQEQLADARDNALSSTLAKTELSSELKSLQQELVTAFEKIEEMETRISSLSSQLDESNQTVTAGDKQRNLLMEEIIHYKNALVNALSNYESEHERALSLEQQLNTSPTSKAEENPESAPIEELRSLINQEDYEDQAALEVPLMG